MLNKLKIGPKLIGGFLVVGMITMAIGILGISNMGKINGLNDKMYENHLLGISHAKEANINLIYIREELLGMFIESTITDRENSERKIETFNKAFRDEMMEVKKSTFNEEGKMLIQKVENLYEDYFKNMENLVSIIKKQELSKADNALMDKLAIVRKIGDDTDKAMIELEKYKERRGKEMFDESHSIYDNMRYLLITLVIIATMAGIALGIFLTFSITRPVNKIVNTARRIAEEDLANLSDNLVAGSNGDLSKSVEIKAEELDVNSEDEIGILGRAFNKMIEKIKISGKAFTQLKKSLDMVSDETIMLTNEALEGHLSARGDIKKFNGVYKDMVDGFNKTLDAVIEPINETRDVLQKVAERDLTARVNGDYKGDMEKLKNVCNTSIENLNDALMQVSQGTEQVASASQQISAGSQSLAQGANQQASSLEEISSSLEEMASMTKQNAENAERAKTLASEANHNATQGKMAMERMSESINKIKESSDHTAKIVKTIDEIAMQTNLLALNAAVEAARAGEAGRGFAVVAEEVRNLAQRSAEAAKNTANMIEDSVKNADEGVRIVDEVAKSFEEITEGSAKVDNIIGEIADASKEQAQDIDQINSAVAQMDKITQQNAANSEESASAAEELSSQAEELQNMVSQFILTNEGHRVAIKRVAHYDSGKMTNTKTGSNQSRASNSGNKMPAYSSNSAGDSRSVIHQDDDAILKEF
ncbi:MAG: HAMP domain-containing protein [Fibrobacter sp.]|nr:HAMP domain-containing protein [Fibrobacter sp.]